MRPTTESTAYLEGNEWQARVHSGEIVVRLKPGNYRREPPLTVKGDTGPTVKTMGVCTESLDCGRRICNECRTLKYKGAWRCERCGVCRAT